MAKQPAETGAPSSPGRDAAAGDLPAWGRALATFAEHHHLPNTHPLGRLARVARRAAVPGGFASLRALHAAVRVAVGGPHPPLPPAVGALLARLAEAAPAELRPPRPAAPPPFDEDATLPADVPPHQLAVLREHARTLPVIRVDDLVLEAPPRRSAHRETRP